MIEENARKEILEDNYDQYRAKADAYRQADQPKKAARLYRKCAETLDRLANLESTTQLARKREDLAANLRTAATELEESGSLSADSPDGAEPSEPKHDRGDSGSEAGGPGDPSTAAGDDAQPGADGDATAAERFLASPPDLDFGDVGGMAELKETLTDKVIDPLDRPELYEEYDLGVVNAVLLYGPPGTGKTYMTRALAGELGYQYIQVDPTDITSSLVGEAADNVAALFATARENQPCIVFIDEIDGLMPERSGGSQKTQSERQMVNQFLTELTETRGADVIVVGATNLPEEVDQAAVSRFQERIEVPPPGPAARGAILRVHLRNRPVLHEAIDWDAAKDATAGYTARDLEIVATNAARAALEESETSDDLQPITQEHLETAIETTDGTLVGATGG